MYLPWNGSTVSMFPRSSIKGCRVPKPGCIKSEWKTVKYKPSLTLSGFTLWYTINAADTCICHWYFSQVWHQLWIISPMINFAALLAFKAIKRVGNMYINANPLMQSRLECWSCPLFVIGKTIWKIKIGPWSYKRQGGRERWSLHCWYLTNQSSLF